MPVILKSGRRTDIYVVTLPELLILKFLSRYFWPEVASVLTAAVLIFL